MVVPYHIPTWCHIPEDHNMKLFPESSHNIHIMFTKKINLYS
jgi:hypothetical protein